MIPSDAARVLSRLHPADLFPVWCIVDQLQQLGGIDMREARRLKHGIFELMVRWGLEPEDLLGPCGWLM